MKRYWADTDNNSDDDATVETHFNNIYYYGSVTSNSVLQLNLEINKLANKCKHVKTNYGLKETPKIYVHIQSLGGDAMAGLSAMDTMRSCKVPIVTIVDGYAASAATFILMGGTERHMQKNANVLMHQISTEFWGKFKELQDETTNCKKLMDIIKETYSERCTFTKKELTSLLKKELYLNASECLEKGIIDKII